MPTHILDLTRAGDTPDTRGVPRNLQELETFDRETGNLQVIIETPKDRRNKYSYDRKLGVFRLKSVLPAGQAFPFDFGFIPGTLGQDGDPLDILVLMEEPAAMGCLVHVRLIAVIEAEQTEQGKTERNDRLIAVSAASREYHLVESLEQMNPNLINEIEQFFISYNQMSGKVFKPVGRAGKERALELVREGMRK